MLIVKTIVKPSTIHGLGLFAEQVIPKGTKTWILNPLVDITYTKEQIETFSEEFRNYLSMYAYEIEDGKRVLCGDGARHMNHSDNPNIDSIPPYEDMTNRDILPGEELTINYYLFDKESVRLGTI